VTHLPADLSSAVGERGYVRVSGADRAARKARIAFVQTQAEAAGAQEISRILGLGLAAKGYDVHHVFFFRRTKAFDKQPNTFFCMPGRLTGILDVVRMFIALVRHLRMLRPDAVLCLQHYGNIVGAVAARLAGTRAIIANRTSANSLVPWWARGGDLLLGSLGLFKRIVVNSKAIGDEYRRYPPFYRSRVLRIDHGFACKQTDLSRDDARRLVGLPAGGTLLGCVARLHPGKNLAAAVRLLSFDRNWHLAIAGQGAELEQLLKLANSLRVRDRVHFIGELPADRIGVFLRALDVFVFPTRAEIPVIANDLEVLREVLAVDGKPCALFVDADDAGAFAAAVQRILVDRGLSAAMSARGRQLSRKYSLDVMVDQYDSLVESVLTRPMTVSRP
jgi:glycosyltransferase involved in cell wall biosynthesis